MALLCARQPEASPIPTTKLKQPALHWVQVVSVTVGLTSDQDWPALAAFWNAFFLVEQAMQMKPCAVEQVFCEVIICLCRRSVSTLSVSVIFVLIG